MLFLRPASDIKHLWLHILQIAQAGLSVPVYGSTPKPVPQCATFQPPAALLFTTSLDQAANEGELEIWRISLQWAQSSSHLLFGPCSICETPGWPLSCGSAYVHCLS